MLLAGRLDEGELRETKSQAVRSMVTYAAFLPCALAFALYLAAIAFAIRSYRRARGAGFWVLTTLLLAATVANIAGFHSPMYLGRGLSWENSYHD